MESNWGTRRSAEGMVHCTMSQAPLTLVEFKTWPSDTPTTSHDADGAVNSSNGSFCGLIPVPSFAMRFFKDFQRFCPLLPDLVLQLDSGERVNVHRVLFYCCSAYCRQKLKAQQPPIEKDCWSSRTGCSAEPLSTHQSTKLFDCSVSPDVSVIRVPRVDYESLRMVVDFVYSGGLIDRVCLESLPKIRFAATLLGIDEMVTVCDSLFRVYQQGHRNNGQMHCTQHDYPRRSIQSPKREAIVSEEEHNGALITRCKRNVSSGKFKQQRLPSVASVLAEMGTDNHLRLLTTEPRSPVRIKQENAILNDHNHDRQGSLSRDVVSTHTHLNHFVRLIAYNKEDLVISEKYIYSSRITEFQPLLSAYNVLQYMDESLGNSQPDFDGDSVATVQQRHRQSLILFSLSTEHKKECQHRPSCSNNAEISQKNVSDERLRIHLISNKSDICGGDITKCINKDTQRFALLCRLDFSDQNSLFICCQQVLTNFMRGLLPEEKAKPSVLVDLTLDSLYCLKKSCGFKSSFRREPLLTTSECYKALAEYSRPEMGELPLVLLSCSGIFHLEPISTDDKIVTK